MARRFDHNPKPNSLDQAWLDAVLLRWDGDVLANDNDFAGLTRNDRFFGTDSPEPPNGPADPRADRES